MNRLFLRIDAAARQAIPVTLTLILVLLSALPAVLPIFRETSPAWVLIAVFHWSVYRPDLMPVQAVFFIGLLQDFLLGLPPGLSALIFVLLRGWAGQIAGLAAGRSFLNHWVLFAGVAALAFLLRYVIVTLWYERIIGPVPVLVDLAFTIGVFPLISWVFARIQKGLLAHV